MNSSALDFLSSMLAYAKKHKKNRKNRKSKQLNFIILATNWKVRTTSYSIVANNTSGK